MSMAQRSSSRHRSATTASGTVHRQGSTRHAPNNPFDPPSVPTHRSRTHTTTVPSSRHPETARVPAQPSRRHTHKRDHMDSVVIKNGVPLDRVKPTPTRGMTTGSLGVAPTPSRSRSSDNVERQNDKARKPSPRPPKKATHVDVIDKLDYSGIGSATFHHDGPFDACAPSRNKNKTKAPMHAFDDVPLQQADANNKHLSPLAQATIQAMRQPPGSSPYAVTLNTNVGSYGQPPSPTYASPKKKSPKKSALAEAWGIAEPEPFEEFSAGRQSAYDSPMTGSLTSINNPSARTGMTTRAEAFPEYPDSRPQPARRPSRALPPPQPIQLYPEFPEGDPVPMSMAPSAYGERPSGPKRSKSLMQRFRKMRDSPNAPPQTAYEEEPAPPASNIRLVSQRPPPVPERGPMDQYLAGDERGAREKNLPVPPPVSNAEYFNEQGGLAPGNAGINRKGSLMRKMKGVMSR